MVLDDGTVSTAVTPKSKKVVHTNLIVSLRNFLSKKRSKSVVNKPVGSAVLTKKNHYRELSTPVPYHVRKTKYSLRWK